MGDRGQSNDAVTNFSSNAFAASGSRGIKSSSHVQGHQQRHIKKDTARLALATTAETGAGLVCPVFVFVRQPNRGSDRQGWVGWVGWVSLDEN